MRKLPNTIGETFLEFERVSNKIVGIKKLAEDTYERVEKEIGDRDKQEVIEEVKAELAKVEVE